MEEPSHDYASKNPRPPAFGFSAQPGAGSGRCPSGLQHERFRRGNYDHILWLGPAGPDRLSGRLGLCVRLQGRPIWGHPVFRLRRAAVLLLHRQRRPPLRRRRQLPGAAEHRVARHSGRAAPHSRAERHRARRLRHRVSLQPCGHLCGQQHGHRQQRPRGQHAVPQCVPRRLDRVAPV